jgi:platelet-activating factor acetylhydrolase
MDPSRKVPVVTGAPMQHPGTAAAPPNHLYTPNKRFRILGVKWRYLILAATAIYFAYCFITRQPLFAHLLPKHTGPYAVGAVDIEYPLSPPRIIDPNIRFKDPQLADDIPFQMDSVLFTLYYPASYADTQKRHVKRHPWIPHPVSLRAEGYARAAHISNAVTNRVFALALHAFAGSITIPAAVDVPLSDHASRKKKFARSWDKEESVSEVIASETAGHPVIVFSHGTVSSRADYSHYAGELAARGYVVAMLEHRDGSCPGSLVHTAEGKKRRLLFDESEIVTADGGEIQIEDFHKTQLAFREAEMEEAAKVLKLINAGHGDKVFAKNARGEGKNLADWTGRLNTDEMIVAGHSYGATGALGALRGGPSTARPFIGGLLLDPGKSSGPLNTDIHVPILVVHSNSWSSKSSLFYGHPHFDTVKGIVEANNARGNPSWFMTSLGTSHPSVTDAPLLEPLLLRWTTGAAIDVYQGLRQYVHVAEDFLGFLADGKKRGLLEESAEFPQYDGGVLLGVWKQGQKDRAGKTGEEVGQGEGLAGGVPVGEWWDWRNYWQIHVAPPVAVATVEGAEVEDLGDEKQKVVE